MTRDYGLETAHEESFDYTAHTQKLSGLEPSTTYHYAVVSMDKAGNRKVSKDFTFVTAQGDAASTPAPESTPEPKPTAAPTPAPTDPRSAADRRAQAHAGADARPNNDSERYHTTQDPGCLRGRCDPDKCHDHVDTR